MDKYVQLIKRRILYFLIPFVLVAGAGVTVVVILPPIYQSTGTILVESQQIPTELIRSTVTSVAHERIQVIKQRVMTRANLLKIINKFNLYKNEEDKMTVTEMVQDMRSKTVVKLINANQSSRRRSGESVIAFSIAYQNQSANASLRVINELITLFLNENVKTRTARASETTDFLKQEALKLKRNLESIENQIAEYKQENSDALPESIGLRETNLLRAQNELQSIDMQIRSSVEEEQLLGIKLSTIRASIQAAAAAAVSPTKPDTNISEESYEHYENLLAEKSLVYGEQHPEIKRIKRKLLALKDAPKEEPKEIIAPKKAPQIYNPATQEAAIVQGQISAIKARIETFKEHREKLIKHIADLEKKIIQTPQVERALIALNRDYENALLKYEEIKRKQMEAQMAENLEADQKAERFSLLEPPVLPETPVKPDRKKLIAIAIVGSLGIGGAIAVGAEMLNRSVRTQADLARILNRQPIGIIPYIETYGDSKRKKRRLKLLIFMFITLMMVVLAGIHFLYMNLDIVILKVLVRLGW
jgi:polysaccharide chain length determinant protein (PEP-CTERM system associated)